MMNGKNTSARDRIPAPTVVTPPVLPQPVPPVAPPAPAAPASRISVTSGGVLFRSPTIELGAYEFLDADGSGERKQVKRLTPKVALVVHGAIVIEEMNLILPLAGNLVRS